jgi:hypothetical protein
VALQVLEEARHPADHVELMRVDGAELTGLVFEPLGSRHYQRHGVWRFDDDLRDGDVELANSPARWLGAHVNKVYYDAHKARSSGAVY